MRPILAALLVLGLTGCIGNPPRSAGMALHDLGPPGGTWPDPGVPIVAVDLQPAAWLASPAQLYRLAYADALRRHTYTESRWVAPPAELIEGQLQRRIVYGQPDLSAPGCRLALTLDEFEQRFDSAQASRTVLEVSARLLPARGETLLARHAFTIAQPAPTADAHGGAEAARAAVDTLVTQLAQWLGRLAQEHSPVIARCKEKS
jgi:cholesterol transport system auxiliary component